MVSFVTIDVPEGSPVPVTDFLGVDMGIARIATTSDNAAGHCGQPVEQIRRKHNIQRKHLQRKRTRGAQQELVRVSGKEAPSAVMKTIALARRSSSPPGARPRDCHREPRRHPGTGHGLGRRCSQQAVGLVVPAARGFPLVQGNARGNPDRAGQPRQYQQTFSVCGHWNGATARARLNSRASAAGPPRTPIGTLPKPPGTGSPL